MLFRVNRRERETDVGKPLVEGIGISVWRGVGGERGGVDDVCAAVNSAKEALIQQPEFYSAYGDQYWRFCFVRMLEWLVVSKFKLLSF